MKFIYLVWRNLVRKKLRTTLTVLSILIAFLLYGFLGAIRQSLTAGVRTDGADRLVVRHSVSITQMLPAAYKEHIERIQGVVAAVHQSWFGGFYQDPKNTVMSMPVVPEEYLAMFPDIVLAKVAQKDWQADRTGAVVGRTTANRFGWRVGDRVTLKSSIWQRENGSNAWEFNIVGIYDGAKKDTDTSGFYFRYDYFDEGRAYAKGQIGWYTVKVKSASHAGKIAKEIDAEFANSACETKAEPEGVFAQGFAQQVGDIGAMMIAILSPVFFTIILVAGNTMAQAVRERTEELGVLKAMGFTNELVFVVVLAESTLISVLGGLTGLGFAWLITSRGSLAPGMFPVFFVPLRDLVIGVGLAFVLGLVAGVFPALQAMKLHTSTALRRQT
ncbi:MAG: ABC transporter permease [Verrucomicrobia bacterium]|nr:ABC transporter permease [Verrucomicrobiota bacterium]